MLLLGTPSGTFAGATVSFLVRYETADELRESNMCPQVESAALEECISGGWLGSIVFDASPQNLWSLQFWTLLISGSIVVLLIWGLITG
ncbi:hypothetical protein [Leucobacter aridicollis]|uniref:hypothetical protein n=1 Tax=Leucobacter aridicollis TaxID=283878 RepID=UPI000E656240|nr:hypothetical protein [Leucobacter aridicollis]UTX54017.1 hypothetical protein KI794_04670 [Leucobacter aridicollis]